MKYLFELGRQLEISAAELQAVFERDKISFSLVRHSPRNERGDGISQFLNNYLILEIDQKIDVTKIISQLGGTIKIAKSIKNIGDSVKSIVHFLNENSTGKIHFSVSGEASKKTGIAIKKQLKTLGRSVRFVEIKNTATILHNNLVEKQSDFTIVKNDVFVTEALQDIEGFSKRDYGRPSSDNKSGMLPPKLARIMINLSGIKIKDALLDPFCGSGTILTEAIALGFKNITGSDISDKAINDTRKNIEWLEKSCKLQVASYRLYKSDATQLLNHLKPESVNAIISEPYMGKPLYGKELKEQLKTQAQELSKLYIESFKIFHKILKKGGIAVFIIPKFRCNNDWITIHCVEEIQKIGFESVPFDKQNKSLLYWRTKQYVGREIWKFKKVG